MVANYKCPKHMPDAMLLTRLYSCCFKKLQVKVDPTYTVTVSKRYLRVHERP